MRMNRNAEVSLDSISGPQTALWKKDKNQDIGGRKEKNVIVTSDPNILFGKRL